MSAVRLPAARAARARPLHLLIVTECYPPDPSVGSVRPAAVVEALRAAGHRVTVITAAAAAEAPGVRREEDGHQVIAVRARENPIRALARLNPLRALTRVDGSVDLSAVGTSREPVRQRVRRWLLSLFLIPDESQGFILPAARAARARHATEPVDLLLTTAPPFSTHLAGLRIARTLGVPWAAEFRDPWTPRAGREDTRSRFSDWVERLLERRVLRRCALVVAVTPTIAEGLDRKSMAGGTLRTSLVALNGVPREVPATPRSDGPIQILHAGELYLGRDPEPFLRVVAAARQAGRFGPEGARITFMGASGGSYRGTPVMDIARQLGLADWVEIVPQVPLEEARLHMARADLLLLLAQEQPAQIPNKLYDYLATRRPILAYVDDDGESARLLRLVGGHCLVPGNGESSAGVIVEFLLAARATPAGSGMNPEALASLRTEHQLEAMVRALEALGAVP